MLLDWLRPDGFTAALKTYGLARCCWAGQMLCLGLGPDPGYNRRPLQVIPTRLPRVGFFEAPLQTDLLRAFLDSRPARHVEQLFLGTSHDYAAWGAVSYDLSPSLAALQRARLPRLKVLSLGDMELLANGHRLFGTLGNISAVFAAAPALTRLQLHGHFRLPHPVQHRHLQELFVEVDDIGITGGAAGSGDSLQSADLGSASTAPDLSGPQRRGYRLQL